MKASAKCILVEHWTLSNGCSICLLCRQQVIWWDFKHPHKIRHEIAAGVWTWISICWSVWWPGVIYSFRGKRGIIGSNAHILFKQRGWLPAYGRWLNSLTKDPFQTTAGPTVDQKQSSCDSIKCLTITHRVVCNLFPLTGWKYIQLVKLLCCIVPL